MALYDPLERIDRTIARFGGPPKNPQLTPEEERSLLGSIGHHAMSGLETVGNVLDTPGAAVRNLLTGRNPLPGVFDPSERTSGRQMLEQAGILGPNQEGLDVGDVAGLAAEIATDPLTYLTLGGSAATKLGKAVKSAGLAKNLSRTQKLKTTVGKVLSTSTPEQVESFVRAAPDASYLRKAALDEPLTQHGRFHIPGVVDTTFDYPGGARVAKGIENVGQTIAHGKIPFTNYAPGEHFIQAFNAAVKGAKTRQGQDIGRAATQAEELGRPKARGFAGQEMKTSVDMGLTQPADRERLRAIFEDPTLISGPEEQAMYDRVRGELDRTRSELHDLGAPAHELDEDVSQYFPRRISSPLGRGTKASAVQLSGRSPADIARLEQFKNIHGGTAIINRIGRDVDINALIRSGADEKAIAQLVEAKYGPNFYDAAQIPAFAKTIKSIPEEVRAAGIFGNDPFIDLQQHLLGRNRAKASLDAAYAGLAGLAQPAAVTPDTATVADVLGKLGVEAGDNTRGALKHIAARKGVPVTPDLLNLRLPKDVADDIVRVHEGFSAPESVNRLVDAIDSITNATKAFQTSVRPAFHVRNLTSGQIQNLLMGAFNASDVAAVKGMLAGGEIKGISNVPIVRDMMAQQGLKGDKAGTDVFRQLLMQHEIVGRHPGEVTNVVGQTGLANQRTMQEMLGEFPGGLGGSQPVTFTGAAKKAVGAGQPGVPVSEKIKPWALRGVQGRPETTFAPLKGAEDVGYLVEGLNRASPFLTLLRRGMDPATAASKINSAQAIYANRFFTPFESRFMARAFPYYKFSRSLGPYVLQELLQHPGGPMAQSIRAANAGRDTGELVPEQIAGGAAIRIPSNIPFIGPEPGAAPRYLTSLGLMHEDPLQFAAGPRDAMMEVLSRLNPLGKGAIEYATGRSLFQRGSRGGRPLEDLDPTIGRTLANVLGRDEPIHYPGERLVEAALPNIPGGNLAALARTATDPRKNAATKAANLLTGLRLTDVPERVQDAIIRDMAQQQIHSLPGAKSFTDIYLPAEELARLPPEQQAQAMQARAVLTQLERRARKRKPEAKKTPAGAPTRETQ